MCGGEIGDGEADLREKTIIEFLVELFTHKVPTMNTADAETLSSHVVSLPMHPYLDEETQDRIIAAVLASAG